MANEIIVGHKQDIILCKDRISELEGKINVLNDELQEEQRKIVKYRGIIKNEQDKMSIISKFTENISISKNKFDRAFKKIKIINDNLFNGKPSFVDTISRRTKKIVQNRYNKIKEYYDEISIKYMNLMKCDRKLFKYENGIKNDIFDVWICDSKVFINSCKIHKNYFDTIRNELMSEFTLKQKECLNL